MEQNIQYLYEYSGEKRVRNLGFMKMATSADGCAITIHASRMDEIVGIQFQRADGSRYLGGWSLEIPVMEASETVEEYISSSNCVYEKISRKDLARLPRKEWKIANNSFLLHGVHNYHHLLYIEEDGEIWIGVPGIFHEKEQLAASTFGFGNFRRMTDVNIELTEEEQNRHEDFGYWCRKIEG